MHRRGGAVLVSGLERQSLGRATRYGDRRRGALVGRVRQAHHGRGEPPVARPLRTAPPAARRVHSRAGARAAPPSRGGAA